MRASYIWKGYRTNQQGEQVWCEETVYPERWQWVATYADGTGLTQFDDATGLFHRFEEIDSPRLVSFAMVNLDKAITHTILYHPNMKLFHFYRKVILAAGTPQETRVKVYYFGYEMKANDLTTKHFIAIDPNDGLVFSNEDFSLEFQFEEAPALIQ